MASSTIGLIQSDISEADTEEVTKCTMKQQNVKFHFHLCLHHHARKLQQLVLLYLDAIVRFTSRFSNSYWWIAETQQKSTAMMLTLLISVKLSVTVR